MILFYVALAILLAGILIPGWNTARIPKRAMKRRVYWTTTAVAIPLLFAAGLPDRQSSLAFVGMGVILMVGWACFRTPNIKIDGRILAAYPPNCEPDPPPTGDQPPS